MIRIDRLPPVQFVPAGSPLYQHLQAVFADAERRLAEMGPYLRQEGERLARAMAAGRQFDLDHPPLQSIATCPSSPERWTSGESSAAAAGFSSRSGRR